jgi:hypothetical protein
LLEAEILTAMDNGAMRTRWPIHVRNLRELLLLAYVSVELVAKLLELTHVLHPVLH